MTTHDLWCIVAAAWLVTVAATVWSLILKGRGLVWRRRIARATAPTIEVTSTSPLDLGGIQFDEATPAATDVTVVVSSDGPLTAEDLEAISRLFHSQWTPEAAERVYQAILDQVALDEAARLDAELEQLLRGRGA